MLQTIRAAAALRRRSESDPKAWFRWLPPQLAFFRDPSRTKLLRLGNQIGGKTTAALAEVDWRCTGKHPYLRVPKPPVKGWIVTYSANQGMEIQQKFWDICDKGAINWDLTQEFTATTGFGRKPVITYLNGSQIEFKSTKQDPKGLASATLDFVLLDEPTSQRIFEELKSRLLMRNGTFLISTTPIGADLRYLRAEVEAGLISDHHYPLRAEFLIPENSRYPRRLPDGEFMDNDWIRRRRESSTSAASPIIIDGGWDFATTNAYFGAFARELHVITYEELIKDATHWDLRLGIDHGLAENKQCASLLAVETRRTPDPDWEPRILILDEYFAGENSSHDDDAAAILKMLEKWRTHWQELDLVAGDRPHNMKYRGAAKKSNEGLFSAIKKRLGNTALLPTIRQAKTGKGGGADSVAIGCEWLRRKILVRGAFKVLETATRTIDSFQKWDGGEKSEWKDILDAIRYATWDLASQRAPGLVRQITIKNKY